MAYVRVTDEFEDPDKLTYNDAMGRHGTPLWTDEDAAVQKAWLAKQHEQNEKDNVRDEVEEKGHEFVRVLKEDYERVVALAKESPKWPGTSSSHTQSSDDSSAKKPQSSSDAPAPTAVSLTAQDKMETSSVDSTATAPTTTSESSTKN